MTNNKNNKQAAMDATAETTIELKVALTKIIPSSTDAAKATIAADRAVRAILTKLGSMCDDVQVLSDKRFPDLHGDE